MRTRVGRVLRERAWLAALAAAVCLAVAAVLVLALRGTGPFVDGVRGSSVRTVDVRSVAGDARGSTSPFVAVVTTLERAAAGIAARAAAALDSVARGDRATSSPARSGTRAPASVPTTTDPVRTPVAPTTGTSGGGSRPVAPPVAPPGHVPGTAAPAVEFPDVGAGVGPTGGTLGADLGVVDIGLGIATPPIATPAPPLVGLLGGSSAR